MRPLRTIMTAVRNSLTFAQLRCIEPVWKTRPYFFWAAMTLRASSMENVSGFSQ